MDNHEVAANGTKEIMVGADTHHLLALQAMRVQVVLDRVRVTVDVELLKN